MKSSKRKICQAVAVIFSAMAASAAMAQAVPVVIGGGSSLVFPSIQSEIATFGTSEGVLSYFSVGSGAGQNAFLNNDATQFGQPASATVDFANSDAALSATQISTYQNGRAATDGPLIQIPFIVTPITIPLINGPTPTDTTTPQTTPGQAHSIALNDADLCKLFSGQATNWNQLTDPVTGSAYPSTGPIKIVYRTDGSGTTDLLTRHLAAVCPAPSGTVTFTETQTFASLFAGGTPPASIFIGASGSGGVATELKSLASQGVVALAYLSPDFTNTFLAPASTSAAANQFAVASLRNTATGTDFAPTAANATAALGTVTPPSDPFDPAGWVPNAGNPTAGYPVSGTSQVIVSQCYANPAVATALHDFLNDHYTNPTFASIIHGNGFDTVPANFEQAIADDFLSNASHNFLDIGNPDICIGVGR